MIKINDLRKKKKSKNKVKIKNKVEDKIKKKKIFWTEIENKRILFKATRWNR